MVGVKSSARRLGGAARRGVAIFYAVTFAFALLVGASSGLGILFYAVLIAYAAHLVWQVRTLRLDNATLALKLFKSNRDAGFILLAAIALGSLRF